MQLQDVKGAVVELSLNGFEPLGRWEAKILRLDTEKPIPQRCIDSEGAGFGHGVGLCQYGAEARARSGMTWREILSLSYPGAKIANNWGP